MITEEKSKKFKAELEAELERHSNEITRLIGGYVIGEIGQMFSNPDLFKELLKASQLKASQKEK